MCTEEAMRRFLEETCYTTQEEKDPRKPLILEGEFLRPNPDFDLELLRKESREKEIERRRKHLGTSFFLNFDPLCHLHQLEGQKGEFARADMARQLRERFVDVFAECCGSIDPPPVAAIKRILRVEICPYAQRGFNNGEVYLWLPNIPLTEEFVFQILKGFRDSLEKKPIVANVDGEDYEVQFYGWGFRYY